MERIDCEIKLVFDDNKIIFTFIIWNSHFLICVTFEINEKIKK